MIQNALIYISRRSDRKYIFRHPHQISSYALLRIWGEFMKNDIVLFLNYGREDRQENRKIQSTFFSQGKNSLTCNRVSVFESPFSYSNTILHDRIAAFISTHDFLKWCRAVQLQCWVMDAMMNEIHAAVHLINWKMASIKIVLLHEFVGSPPWNSTSGCVQTARKRPRQAIPEGRSWHGALIPNGHCVQCNPS